MMTESNKRMKKYKEAIFYFFATDGVCGSMFLW
jgi:hypothetical protein